MTEQNDRIKKVLIPHDGGSRAVNVDVSRQIFGAALCELVFTDPAGISHTANMLKSPAAPLVKHEEKNMLLLDIATELVVGDSSTRVVIHGELDLGSGEFNTTIDKAEDGFHITEYGLLISYDNPLGNPTAEVQAATYEGQPLKEMPNPTEEDLKNPIFEALWQATKRWDVNSPEYYVGYCGMNGSHIKIMLDALAPAIEKNNGILTALTRVQLFSSAMGTLKAGLTSPSNTESIFEAVKLITEVAELAGVAIKLNMPTAKEKETHKTNTFLTVSDAEGKVLMHPTPSATGVQLKD